jgi:RNA polymerase sigma-70 factor (ECF subfamily)
MLDKPIAITDLFAENAVWMRRLARSLLADESRAEDALQDTWLELLRHPPRETASIRGWLATVVRNLARKQHRQEERRSRREHSVARAEPTMDESREIIERVELSQRLVSMVLELDEPYRSTVLLRFFEDVRPVDIARRQGIPVTTVSSRVQHALELLRTRLKQEKPGTWKVLLVLIALQGAGARALAAGASSAVTSLAGGASASSSPAVGTTLATGAVLMSKKAAVAVCLSAAAFLSGGFGLWYATSSSTGQGDPSEQRIEDSARFKSLVTELRSAQRKLEAAASENASLGAAKRDLESQLAELQGRGDKEKEEGLPAIQRSSESDLSWGELSSLISGNVDILEKLARGERLQPEDQSRYDLLAGELLKLSSRAKMLSKDPLLDEPIFRDLVTALFGGPLSLTEKQSENLRRVMDGILEGLPENVEGMDSLDRYRLRQEIASRLERGVEGMLEDEQRERWEGVRSFAQTALTYGGKMTLGTAANARSLLVNWSSNALGGPVDGAALEATTPAAEAYLERAKDLLSRYGGNDEALKGLFPEAKAALEADFLNLQRTFYEEVSPHLSEELRGKLRDDDPLIIRFEHGQGTWITGRRRYF